MYYVCKRLEISAAHSLMLSYESKCEDLHGHNWIVKIYCKSETLNQDGMVTDFTLIKRDIEKALDCASKIGDDYLQKKSQGYVVSESFTHGTAQQRYNWLKKGMTYGDLEHGNTFEIDYNKL